MSDRARFGLFAVRRDAGGGLSRGRFVSLLRRPTTLRADAVRRRAIAATLIFAALLGAANAQTSQATVRNVEGLTIVESRFAVDETERRLTQAITARGLKVAARIDHAANAKNVQQALAPTVLVLFGSPKTGTPLIQQHRSVAIDLPLKILIWEEDGRARLGYNNTAYLARRHTVENQEVLGQIDQLLASLASAATSP